MSYCEIEVDDWIGEDAQPTEYTEYQSTATETSQCCECGSDIEIGEDLMVYKYEYYYPKEQGKGRHPDNDDYSNEIDPQQTTTYHWCIGCKSVVDVFFKSSWWFTQVWENMEDCLQEYNKFPEDKVNQLNQQGKELFFERIEEYWEEIDDV